MEIAYLMNTGMLVWHAETAQDFYDWILKGYMVSEEPDVHLPLALCCDGFFVTHTKDVVDLTPVDMCLPPYDPYRSPVPCMDMECPPVRMMRDPFVMKSNYISYATHASWQQEIWAAAERSRKHTIAWLDGLIETENVDADILIVASGTAVSQGREAIRLLADEGIHVGLVKIKTLRPVAGGRNSRGDQARLAHHRAGVQCHRVDGARNQSHDSSQRAGRRRTTRLRRHDHAAGSHRGGNQESDRRPFRRAGRTRRLNVTHRQHGGTRPNSEPA